MKLNQHLFLCLAGILSLAAPVACHAAPDIAVNLKTDMIYAGTELSSSSPVQASDWGGGDASDTTTGAYTSAGHAIKIETAGPYQGGIISFTPPLPISDDKTEYLQFIVTINPSPKYNNQPAPAPADAAPQPMRYIQGSSLFHLAQFPQGMPPPGNPPGNFPPGGAPPPNGQAPVYAPAAPTLPIQSIHLIFSLTDGTQTELVRPINIGSGDINWLQISVPYSTIMGSATGSAKIAKVYIGSDSPAEIIVGQIQAVQNTTPLSAFAGQEETVPTGSAVQFSGTGDGGASTLKYEWDFDSPNKFVDEADGQNVTHTFAAPGNYNVELRVVDVDGIKPPATSDVTIQVVNQ